MPSTGTLRSLVPRLRELRHDLHRHPELGFEEHRTQEIVLRWLRDHGYDPRTCADTGVVADLFPERVGRATTIALRADLDCLPMQERTDLPYRSVHDGRAHKCGHDGHTAILLGVAAELARRKNSIEGNVRLIFQPAEEGVRGGGAKVMIHEGVLSEVAEIYGLHNWPNYAKGEVRVAAGPLMAETHELRITIAGKGGHGSQPQLCRDPIVAAAQLVVALQTVVSRGLGYEGGAVLSVCTLNSGEASNVIPEHAKLSGTIRTFEAHVRTRVVERVREIAAGIATSYGVVVEVALERGYPALINTPTCADAVRRVACQLFGEARVSDRDLPMAGSEDFAYFAQQIPAAYFFLGAGVPGESTPGCHHPDFDFDDDLIPVGVQMLVGIVADRIGEAAARPEVAS
ncbi:MAG: amidohydrolase [Nannocystaceae bacterium]